MIGSVYFPAGFLGAITRQVDYADAVVRMEMKAAEGDTMHDKRRYNRFKLNDREVNGKMVLATEVKVIDISISGIALKANRRLNIGSDYILKLEGSKTISLRGTVIWCSLGETRKGSQGEVIPIYAAGMQFKDMSDERTMELQYFIENHKIEAVHVVGGTRLNIRFHIKEPENAILIYPDNFEVKTISLGGMLIESLRHLEIESRIPMEMFIHDDNPLKFVGRVASMKAIDGNGQKHYRIGIEFLDLTEADREVLASFIDLHGMTETETEKEQGTTGGKSADEDSAGIPKDLMETVEYLHKWHTSMGYYKMVGIHEYANTEQIRQAFLKRAQELHQDKFPDASEDLKQKLNEIFSYLNLARATLLDPQKRREYDRRPITRIRH
jgi:c-di-GMP-binding flagellar brake protein YcgR